MIKNHDVEEIPGYTILELEVGGGIVFRDSSDFHTYMDQSNQKMKVFNLPNMNVKWGWYEDW